jgi:hypothetical protein
MLRTTLDSVHETATESPFADVWLTFPAVSIHAWLARLWLAGWLEAQCPGTREQAFETLLAFSELGDNAVFHGAGPTTVHAWLTGRATSITEAWASTMRSQTAGGSAPRQAVGR